MPGKGKQFMYLTRHPRIKIKSGKNIVSDKGKNIYKNVVLWPGQDNINIIIILSV